VKTLLSPVFESKVFSAFSIPNSLKLICVYKVVLGALSMAGCKAVGAGGSRQQWVGAEAAL